MGPVIINTGTAGRLDFDTDVTLSANSDSILSTQKASKAYADSLVIGLLDDRGNLDASGNLFPSTGGSGAAGAILKGDTWRISVAGVLGGVNVIINDWIRSLSNTPAQTAANWSIMRQPVTTLSPVSLTYEASLTPNCDDGLYRKITVTGALTINAPTNSTEGMKWKVKLLASGANRTVTFNAAIKIPSSSTFTGAQIILSGETYIAQLEYSGTEWWLQTLIGGWL